MSEKDPGSLEGRGREELLPDRGDPFDSDSSAKPISSQSEFEHLIPEGAERAQEDLQSSPTIDAGVQGPGIDDVEIDHGLGAVGPPLPEDLSTAGLPIPAQDVPQPTVDQKEHAASRTRFSTLLDVVPSVEQPAEVPFEEAAQQEAREKEPLESALSRPEPEGKPAAEKRSSTGAARPVLQGYALLMGALCITALLLLPFLLRTYLWPRIPAWSAAMRQDLLIFFRALLWGGLGGVLSGLIGLHTHARLKRPVERPWTGWYLFNPLLGMLLGAFVFLLLRATFLAFAADSTSMTLLTWLASLLAALLGFFQDLPARGVEGLAMRLDLWRSEDDQPPPSS